MINLIEATYAYLSGLPPDDYQAKEFHQAVRSCILGNYYLNYKDFFQPASEKDYEKLSADMEMFGLRMSESASGLVKFLNSDDLELLKKELPPMLCNSLADCVLVEKSLSMRETHHSIAEQKKPAKRF